MADIVKGEQNWKDKINNYMDANDKDITTLKAGQNLTWVNLPLESGITGNLSVAAGYGGIVYIKGQINGSFTGGTVLAKTVGTPLASKAWVDTPVVASSGLAFVQANSSGSITIQGISGTAGQINASGFFAK